MPNQKHREGLFFLLCLAAAGICAGLAFRFAVPLQAQTRRHCRTQRRWRSTHRWS